MNVKKHVLHVDVRAVAVVVVRDVALGRQHRQDGRGRLPWRSVVGVVYVSVLAPIIRYTYIVIFV